MNTLNKTQEHEVIAVNVSFSNDMICLILSDGREVKTPLEFYPLLAKATEEQLQNYRLIGDGSGIHWNDLDEDLSVESIVLGRKAYNYPRVS